MSPSHVAPSNSAFSSNNGMMSESNASSLFPSVVFYKSIQIPNTSHFTPNRSSSSHDNSYKSMLNLSLYSKKVVIVCQIFQNG